jgi:cytochrome o ubiquinol oxidase subunit 2
MIVHNLAGSVRAKVALLIGLTLAGCEKGILNPAGPVGRAERIILVDSLAIMLSIVIPTILVTLTFAWWYRASNKKAQYRPKWAYSGRLELLVWSIPTLVILFLGGVIWIGSHDLDPAKPFGSPREPLEVQVISLDWKWLFIYPDLHIASVNRLIVPANRPLHFSLTSGSVMNMFFVPQLGSMIATMNRMVTQLYLEADQPGEYYGRSAQFSGDGFSDMQFILRAVSKGEFDEWVNSTRLSGPVLDDMEYATLSKQSANVPAFTYRAASANLFHAVVDQKLAPGPGPESARVQMTGERMH